MQPACSRMSWGRLRTAQSVMGQSSFTGEENIHRESMVDRYFFSAATTAGGSASLRMEVLVFGVLSCSSPFTS